MSKLLKLPLYLLAAALCFFVVTFTIYMFNLDMKATALLAPWLEKWYDHLEHKQYICLWPKRKATARSASPTPAKTSPNPC